MFTCGMCPYYSKDEETGFGVCLFSDPIYPPPCEEPDPVYESEMFENMSDEELKEVFEDFDDDFEEWDLDEGEELE